MLRDTSVSYTHLDVYKRQDNIVIPTDKENGIMKKISNQYGFKTYTCLLYTSRCV